MKINDFLTGKIIKIHSDFIYVKSGNKLFECRMRERLKKEKVDVYTGDEVKIEEINEESSQAAVVEVFERKNYMTRPAVANIDQIIIVASIAEPGLDYIQLNRYLCLAKLNKIPAVICINKIDLKDGKEKALKQVRELYEPLGYKVIYTSAHDGSGLEHFRTLFPGKVSVLSGMSGVGKSTLLNRLNPDLNLKTKKVSPKTGKGTHTTRHTELIDIPISDKESCQVSDSPGFSYLKFDIIMPSEVQNLFDDIKKFADGCYFSDCLHLEEEKCNVINNLNFIEKTRYLSYKTFVKEAFEYKKRITSTGQKKETTIKTKDLSGKGKNRIVKLGVHAKEESRRKTRQQINLISNLEDIYYNNDDLE